MGKDGREKRETRKRRGRTTTNGNELCVDGGRAVAQGAAGAAGVDGE